MKQKCRQLKGYPWVSATAAAVLEGFTCTAVWEQQQPEADGRGGGMAGEGRNSTSKSGGEYNRRRPVQPDQELGTAHGGRTASLQVLQSLDGLGRAGEKGWTSLHGWSVGCACPLALI